MIAAIRAFHRRFACRIARRGAALPVRIVGAATAAVRAALAAAVPAIAVLAIESAALPRNAHAQNSCPAGETLFNGRCHPDIDFIIYPTLFGGVKTTVNGVINISHTRRIGFAVNIFHPETSPAPANATVYINSNSQPLCVITADEAGTEAARVHRSGNCLPETLIPAGESSIYIAYRLDGGEVEHARTLRVGADFAGECRTKNPDINPAGGVWDRRSDSCLLDPDAFYSIPVPNSAPRCHSRDCHAYYAALRQFGCNPPAEQFKSGFADSLHRQAPAADFTCVSQNDRNLAAEIQKAAPDLAAVRALLDAGASPDFITPDGTPLLIAAALQGRAQIVSVLVTTGAHVAATGPRFGDPALNLDVARHMTAPLSGPAAGPRALRASVLRHFGDALDARAKFQDAGFNWNSQDQSSPRALDLLARAEDVRPRPAGEDADVIYQMADYLRARGGQCAAAADQTRRRVCTAKCPPGQNFINGFCACPAGQGLENGACNFCPPGEGAGADGRCGPCAGGQELINGFCACPAGQDILSRNLPVCYPRAIADAYGKCAASGNTPSVFASLAATSFVCDIHSRDNNADPAGGETADRNACAFPDQALEIDPNARLCSQVFGPGLAFPRKPSGDPPRYVFNCDPFGLNRLLPATINTVGATECGCPAGERFVSTSGAYSGKFCHPDPVADVADHCAAQGWRVVKPSASELLCQIQHRLYDDHSGDELRSACAINGPAAGRNSCAEIFGDPPRFPQADSGDDPRIFAANCSRNGRVPGGIPATINTVGATACGCNAAAEYSGNWPNCGCPPGQGTLADGACGTCPPGQGVLTSGACGVCPPGYGVRENGKCGVCAAGQGTLANGACGLCPPGQGILPNGSCNACPPGQGILNSGDCSPCAGGQEFMGGSCVCPAGERAVVFAPGELQCHPQAAADAADKCRESGRVPVYRLPFHNNDYACDIDVRNAAAEDQSAADHGACMLGDNAADAPRCAQVFGPRLAFPPKPPEAGARYVYNCDPDGQSGFVPATINTIGATQCACPTGQGIVASGVCGACPTGQGILTDGTCGACPTGQIILADQICGACPDGQGIRADQTCGVCPAGQVILAGQICGACPAGQGIRADQTCGACPAGAPPIDGVCTCPAGQGILSRGVCGACPNGKEVIGGVCACPAGTGEFSINGILVGCYPQMVADGFYNCKRSLQLPNSDGAFTPDKLFCSINSRNAASGGAADANRCFLSDNAAGAPLCSQIFGPDPDFPPRPSTGQLTYVYNCDPNGQSGLLPATTNTIGATACFCPPGQALQNGVCAACPPGQGIKNGVCAACPPGQGILANGACAVCPPGQGVVADKTCGACLPGQVVRNGECACPVGKGILPGGGCGLCPVGLGVLADGTCGACPLERAVRAGGGCGVCPEAANRVGGVCICPNGQGFSVSSRCAACLGGQEVINGICSCPAGQRERFVNGLSQGCFPRALADRIEKCDDNLYKNDKSLGWWACFASNRSVASAVGADHCWLEDGAPDNAPLCSTVFGPNLDFPPTTNSGVENGGIISVFNCDPTGENGLLPATVNTIGAVECACPPGQTPQDGVCAVCPPEQGIQPGGGCGACPPGANLIDGVCTCAFGRGIRDDGTCGACPGGQEVINGVCACPAGQRPDLSSNGQPQCYPQYVVAAAEKCRQSGHVPSYTPPDESGIRFPHQCAINVTNVYESGRNPGDFNICYLDDTIPRSPLCTEAFGPGPAFPTKPLSGALTYVFNCDPPGESGLLPATVNTIGATACFCPPGQILQDDVCACPPGQGIMDNGNCGACLPGQSVQDGVCACPSGQGIIAGGTCGACPAGQSVQDGVCACPPGQGVMDDGSCSACVGGQEFINGACACPAGQDAVPAVFGPECYPQTVVDALKKCKTGGYDSAILGSRSAPAFSCAAPSRNANVDPASDGSAANQNACIYPDDVREDNPNARLCSEVFGPDFAFPPKPSDGSAPLYVYNCDPDGNAGLLPATANTVGATQCACAVAGQSVQNGVCACPTGQGILDGACGRCPAGQGVLADGTCGACPAGQGVLTDGVCGACPAAAALMNGVCTCPAGQGVLADGNCGVCPAGQSAQDGVCGACPLGEGVLTNGACGACPPGQVVQRGVCIPCPGGPGPEGNACACPPGEKIVTDSSGSGCFPGDKADSHNACIAQGWSAGTGAAAAGRLACDIPVAPGQNSCAIVGGTAKPCAQVFGDPPQFPPQAGDDGRPFKHNCSSDGTVAAAPGRFNRNGEKECACTTGGIFPNCDPCDRGKVVIDGACGACPLGQDVYRGACVPRAIANRADKCASAGWSAAADNAGFCAIPLTLAGGAATDGCALSGGAAPQCATVFGDRLNFPQKPAAAARYVYNCDPGGASGMIPATANTIEATQCACPAGQGLVDGLCAACPTGREAVDGVCTAVCAPEQIRVNGECSARIPLSATAQNLHDLLRARASVLATAPRAAAALNVAADAVRARNAGDADYYAAVAAYDFANSPDYNWIAHTEFRVLANQAGFSPGPANTDGQIGRALAALPSFPDQTRCATGGWSRVAGANSACGIPVTLAGGAAADACYFAGDDSPQCADAFGANAPFPPPRTADGATLRFVYNCDPNGESGLLPATINTAGATACACPPGKHLMGGTCVANPAADRCLAGGWSVSPTDGVCEIPVRYADGAASDRCYLTGAAAPQCVDIFGEDADFPPPKMENGATLRFVYNCDPDGSKGIVPAAANTVGATACACLDPEKGFFNGDCELSAAVVSGARRCAAAGRTFDAANGGGCAMAITLAGGDLFNRCHFSGAAAPQCADVFGEDFNFPPADSHSGALVYNCDPDGSKGLFPATANTIGATACACPLGQVVKQGGCAAPTTPEERCAAAGWTLGPDGGCEIGLREPAGANPGRCFFDPIPPSAGQAAIPCQSAFGTEYAFPFKPPDGGAPVYIYNCDPDGDAGALPATVNLTGETQCRCDAAGGDWPNCAGKACADAGWDYSAADNACGILLTLAGGVAADRCHLTGSDSPQCAEVFGSTANYFPAPTLAASGATLRFVYDCDPDGDGGAFPATANTIRATACACPPGKHFIGGTCAASPAADSCLAGGWNLSLTDGACAAPVTLAGGAASDRCYFTGSAAPQCADVFGTPAIIPPPTLAASGATLRFVYNCDPNGDRGGVIPAASNTVAATECSCAVAGQTLRDGLCACPPEQGVLTDGTCGACPVGQGVVNGACNACPAETTIVNGVCTCPMAGQVIQGGACACPIGQLIREGACAEPATNAEKCAAAGWTYGEHRPQDRETMGDGLCLILIEDVRADRRHNKCNILDSAGPDVNSLLCADVFGDDLSLPLRPPDNSAPRYVYNCDPNGESGLIPAAKNTIGATQCACPAGQGLRDDGICGVCVAGQELINGVCVSAAIAGGARNCLKAGREFSPANGGDCAVAITLSGGELFDRCHFSGSDSPQCADVFGTDLVFSGDPDAVVIYNCDPDGITGLVPATANTIGAAECACPTREALIDGVCVNPRDKCADAGWSYDAHADACGIGSRAADAADRRFCRFDAAPLFSQLRFPRCQDVFGSDYAFPQKPTDADAPTYAYNCDPNGAAGALPATVNRDGETECRCDASGGTWPDCAGKACAGAGWGYSAADGACGIAVTLVGGAAADRCHLTGSAAPQCADVFGADAVFPPPALSTLGATLRFVYNCDPNGETGLVPATTNTIGATACGCPTGTEMMDGACVSAAAADSCRAGGWTLSAADGICGIAVTLVGGAAADRCHLTGSAAPQCADIFGTDAVFPPPALSTLGATLRFVYNCDPNGESGLVPATTNTIGATACGCPAGTELIGGACVANAAADSCRAGGWTLSIADGSCGIPVTLVGGAAADRCHLTGSAAPQCADVFGADAMFPPPALSTLGATLRFVYNCDPNGESGLLPATTNIIGATACGCPAGTELIGGACVANAAADRCRAGGWTLSIADGGCGIPVTLVGGAAADRCHLTGSAAPQCADVFGADAVFPPPMVIGGATLRFVYNCDPNGESGLLPATTNTIGATACGCPTGTELIGGACIANAAVDSCRTGWTLLAAAGACGIPVTLVGGAAADRCHLTGSAAPQCADVFGPGGLPPPVVEDGATLSFVYNCDPNGESGLLPATENRIGATECGCPAGKSLVDGKCSATAGDCLAAGWPLFAAAGACGIPLTLAGGAADRCYFTGSASPQCADVFGADLDFPAPTLTAGGATLRFVYNCDPGGASGLLPATANTIAATECGCPAGESLLGGECSGLSGMGLDLYNALAADDANSGPVFSGAIKEFLRGILDRFNGDPNYLGDLNDFYTGARPDDGAYDAFLRQSETAGFGAAQAGVPGEIDRTLSQITIGALSGGCAAHQADIGRTCVAFSLVDKCEDAGWTVSMTNGACEIRVTLAGGSAFDQCHLSGGSDPQCAAVFGEELNFPSPLPPLPSAGARRHFVYNCDPDGESGLLPATTNMIGATACVCPDAAQIVHDGVCAFAADLALISELLRPAPDLAAVRELLDSGANPNAALPDGTALLGAAASLNRAGVVSVLITAGANPAARASLGTDSHLLPEFFAALPRGIEGANLLIHWDGAVQIAALTSGVAFNWRGAAGDRFIRQALDARARPGLSAARQAEAEAMIAYAQYRGGGGDCNVPPFDDERACNALRACASSADSTAYSCSACAGSPYRSADGAACVSACGAAERLAAPTSWGEAQCACDAAGQGVVEGECRVCPEGARVVQGACTCFGAGEGLMDGACAVCPEGAAVVGGACACPPGQEAAAGFCVSPAIAPAAQKCADAGWRFSPGAGGTCGARVTLANGNAFNGCHLSGSFVPQCADVFGADLDFPAPVVEGGATLRFVYNCDPRGTSGRLPATVNTVGATSCCSDGQVATRATGGACLAVERAAEAEKCMNAGWEFSTADGGVCAVPVMLGGANAFAHCYFSGAFIPQCADVFGAALAFPIKPPSAATAALVYNCDPGGDSGLLPATINTVGATECACPIGGNGGACACPSGQSVVDGVCRPPVDTALIAEVFKPSPDLTAIRALLDDGANPAVTLAGGAPLVIAALTLGRPKVMSVLITAGADPYAAYVAPPPAAAAASGRPLNIPMRITGSDSPDGLEFLRHWGGAAMILAGSPTLDWSDQRGNSDGAFRNLAGRHFAAAPGRRAELSALGGYLLDLGATCSDYVATSVFNLGIDYNTPLCASRFACESARDGRIHDCSACSGAPLLDGESGACVSVDAARLCEDAGWKRSPVDDICGIPVTLAGGAAADQCHLSGSDSPQCANIFGALFDFPPPVIAADGTTLRFVYNCDPDGDKNRIPATINTVGATACACAAAGEELVGETCVPAAIAVGAQNCLDANREFFASDGGGCAVAITLAGGDLFNKCHFSGSAAPQCEEVFGAGLVFPADPDVTVIYNCDPGGSAGLIPATINTVGATECACPAGQAPADGACVFGAVADRCESAGWAFSAGDGSCGTPVTLSGGAASDRCYLAGSDSPQCAEVFGATVNYFPAPIVSSVGATLRFIYNCDPGGETGLIPASANTVSATECGCDASSHYRENACVPKKGSFGRMSDELLCKVFGGTVRIAADGGMCSGMDENNTLCILDSAAAFPCRGLFKHLRNCNLEFNRPALNSFFCGEDCGEREAFGAGCRDR